MELRARTSPTLRRAGLLAALTALLVPAAAGTANAAKPAPVVTRVTPKHVFVGETLTIRGRHFRRGVNKNTVAFKRDGAKAVFVSAEKGTTKLLKVTLPKRLEKVLLVMNGTRVPTRLKIRVMSSKFGKRYTKRSISPIVGAEKPPAPEAPVAVDPNADCDGDHLKNSVDTDDDNDLLPDTLEKQLKLDQCKVDTDGDGVEDGYEYQSARDLNDDEHQSPNTYLCQTYLPCPEKRPYPNALDGTDGNTDHDGDSLTLKDEYDLWKYTIAAGAVRTLTPLTYSAGEQFSVNSRAGGTGNRTPTLAAAGYAKQTQFLTWAAGAGYDQVALSDLGALTLADRPESPNIPTWFAARTLYDIRDLNRSSPGGSAAGAELTYYDFDGNGVLDDSERDEDADGLTNQSESTGCMTRLYWDKLYDKETPYYLKFAPVRLDDADTDGDGIRDGADDQDHDDVPNIMECRRSAALNVGVDPPAYDPSGFPPRQWKGFLNPYNPCLPHPKSRTCNPHVGVTGAKWAPFNPDEYPKYYLVKD
jgi:hypothetical protein